MTAKKPFELTARPCKIDNINPRVERHGDEEVPAVDIRLTGITLSKAELIRLTGDAQAWNLMFEEGKGGVIEPTLQCFDSTRYLEAKFEECHSTLRFGMQKTEHELDEHKIKSCAFKPLVGGMTELTLTIQYKLDDTKIMGPLTDYQGKEAHAAINFGKVSEIEKRQGKLALNEGAEGEDDKPKNRFGNGEAPDAPATH
jgi:hypothetical protein